MNTTYTLTEGNDAVNRALLMMRYDLGKTLNENVVLEHPEEKSDTPYNKELMRKYNLPSKTMTLDEFMEDYRDALTHPVMVGLEVALTSTGVGVGAVVAAYTALLAYDVYKGVVNKDWDWLNIVFDVLGIVSSGMLSSTLRPIMKGAQGLKFKNFREVFTYLTKTNKWYEIKPYLETGFSLLKSVSKGIWKALEWISRKTGFRQLKVAGKSVETNIHNIIYSVEEFLKKSVKFLEPGAKVGIKKAVKRGAFIGASVYGLNSFIEKYIKPKLVGGKVEVIVPDDDVQTDMLKKLIVKNNKKYFPNEIKQIKFITDKNKNLIKLNIDGNNYLMVDEMKYKLKKI